MKKNKRSQARKAAATSSHTVEEADGDMDSHEGNTDSDLSSEEDILEVIESNEESQSTDESTENESIDEEEPSYSRSRSGRRVTTYRNRHFFGDSD